MNPAAAAAKKLSLVLDHPPLKKTHDQTDDDTRDALATAFGNNLQFAWALERNDPKVAIWIYPSAYHIKVAVRDRSAFWLSSGNFNNSNQPDIDPIGDLSEALPHFKSCDRDWHVIVEHAGLAHETVSKLELLQDAGIDLSHVRIQANVHNKGMIVDSKVVAVGSQNWSGDGTLRNRDATLIIYNEDAAQYWQQIFMHDWTQMSSQSAHD